MTSSRFSAMPSRPRRPGLVDVLGAFAFASDLGAGQPLGHALRTVRLAMTLADRLSLDDSERLRAFHTSFLAHAGCTAGTGDFAGVTANEMAAYGELFALDPTNLDEVVEWLGRHRPAGRSDGDLRLPLEEIKAQVAEHTRGVCEVGHRVAERLGLSEETAQAVKHTFEFWDGSGPYGMRGEAIPIASRITLAALVTDSVQYLHGWDEAQARAQRRPGGTLDPAIVELLGELPEPEMNIGSHYVPYGRVAGRTGLRQTMEDDMTTSAAAGTGTSEATINLFGDLYDVLLDREATDGAISVIRCVIQPGGGPPPHLNPREDLAWYMIENELTFHLGGAARRVTAGESLFIPKDTTDAHTFHNDSDQPAVALFMVTPGGFEGFLREAGVPVGSPTPEPTPEAVAQMVEIGKRYGMEMQVPSPS